MTFGDILFIYWVFSFDLIKIKELADKRINADNKNIIIDSIDEKESFLKKNENSDKNKDENMNKVNNNIENKKKGDDIEMNYINS